MRTLSYLSAHPGALTFLGLSLPAIAASVPILLQKLEVSALAALFKSGDAADQKAIRGVIKVLVVWAEDKYNEGAVKFDTVDTVAAKMLPFLTAEQRKTFIEAAVKDLDAGANQAASGGT